MADNRTDNQKRVVRNKRIRKASIIETGLQAFYNLIPALVSIIVALAVMYFSQNPRVRCTLENDINTINTMIGTMGLILSCFAVYYGRRAYCVAQDIFEKGIQINKKKVLDEVSWEFVSDFFIPLSNLYETLSEYFPKTNGKYRPKKTAVEDVYNRLKRIKLPDRFNYWELHKRDVFDALDINEGHVHRKSNDQQKNKDFFDICGFVEKALELQSMINGVIRALEKNTTKVRDLSVKKEMLNEVFDRLNTNGELSNKLDDIFNQMRILMEYENSLPEELNIKRTILLMKNGNGNNEVSQ